MMHYIQYSKPLEAAGTLEMAQLAASTKTRGNEKRTEGFLLLTRTD
jgi:hypothetical protein